MQYHYFKQYQSILLNVQLLLVLLEVVDNITNTLGADSLDNVELMMEFEKVFGIQIPEEVAEQFQTVGDVINYLEEHKEELNIQ